MPQDLRACLCAVGACGNSPLRKRANTAHRAIQQVGRKVFGVARNQCKCREVVSGRKVEIGDGLNPQAMRRLRCQVPGHAGQLAGQWTQGWWRDVLHRFGCIFQGPGSPVDNLGSRGPGCDDFLDDVEDEVVHVGGIFEPGRLPGLREASSLAGLVIETCPKAGEPAARPLDCRVTIEAVGARGAVRPGIGHVFDQAGGG